MPYSFSQTPVSIQQLSSALINMQNSSVLYIYKDSNGVIRGSNDEQAIQTNNMGYPYQFIDGTQTYTLVPITSIQNIPWNYPYSTLPTGYDPSLVVWIDGREIKAVNQSLQKLSSKGYSSDVLFLETSPTNDFVYSNDNTIDLTNGSYIHSQNEITPMMNFKLFFVFTCPNQTQSDGYVFEYDKLVVKIIQTYGTDETLQYMVCATYGLAAIGFIAFKPSDTNFMYSLYVDNNGSFILSGNTSDYHDPPGLYDLTASKFYIGSDFRGEHVSGIKIHELLFYQNSSAITANYTSMSSYLSSRWSLTTYIDEHNLPLMLLSNTGGDVTVFQHIFGGRPYDVHVCKSNTTLNVSNAGYIRAIYIIGGGASAGTSYFGSGGGGGAGGIIYMEDVYVTAGSYPVVIGQGGASTSLLNGNGHPKSGNNGTASSWNGYTASGGGYGAGGDNVNLSGYNGGCGGGAFTKNGNVTQPGGLGNNGTYSGAVVYSNNGGSALSSFGQCCASGGGGAGSAGFSNTQVDLTNTPSVSGTISRGGNGGDGIQLNGKVGTPLSGVTYYGCGGGGGSGSLNGYLSNPMIGLGLGSGGNNSANNTGAYDSSQVSTVQVVTPNTGCGGGCVSFDNIGGRTRTLNQTIAGASGLVIFAY